MVMNICMQNYEWRRIVLVESGVVCMWGEGYYTTILAGLYDEYSLLNLNLNLKLI